MKLVKASLDRSRSKHNGSKITARTLRECNECTSFQSKSKEKARTGAGVPFNNVDGPPETLSALPNDQRVSSTSNDSARDIGNL